MKLKITVENKTYEVDVEASASEVETPGSREYSAPAAIRQAKAPSAPVAAPKATVVEDEAKVCRSPISGIVVKVSAQPGQSIQKGDTLLVLEAMKMETNITAPIAGKVTRVNAGVGDSVQGNQVLVEFE